MRKIRYNVITFPGSNCDHDAYWVAKLNDADCDFVWHKDSTLKRPDVVVFPGGFSYGDYLRCGAIAKFSAVMKPLVQFAERGGLVIGICNGFQILTECGLLPGTLMMNSSLHFVCQHQFVKIENTQTPFTCEFEKDDVVDFPIAHKEGNYFVDQNTLKEIIDNEQIALRYCDKQGNVSTQSNPNGSIDNIAGILNKTKNVMGMMPHPERAAENILPSNKGAILFQSINKWVNENL